MTDYKEQFLIQLKALKIQTEPEFRFSKVRRFRADWRVVGTNLLIDYEGGIFARKTSHSSIGGIVRDIEKGNEAMLCGFSLLRITAKHVASGEALAWVERALRGPFYVEQR